ncbi:hypothetical protein GJAV_G00023200 [Gymnothorax javanicus]|nr:hypothetical protein GJAV_G00023200 [Gymnothorax javanicus]
MSSQKGNVSRTRGQKHQNSTAFKNNKYGATVQVKKANAKVHDGVCQHCKEVLEWKVKYMKYKPLTQPRKCVKCLQKAVRDAYHIMCKACALQLELCAKCGKKEEIVIPLRSETDGAGEDEEEQTQDTEMKKRGRRRRTQAQEECFDEDSDDFDCNDDFGAGSDLDSSDSDTRPENKQCEDPVPQLSSLQVQHSSKLG